MGYLNYKGYTGSVEYNEEDNCLFGKVQGMRSDSITYEGNTVEELTKDFHNAIDDYLLLCEEKGIKPKNPYSGTLNVRLTPDVHSQAALAADRVGISINAFIKNAVIRDWNRSLLQYDIKIAILKNHYSEKRPKRPKNGA